MQYLKSEKFYDLNLDFSKMISDQFQMPVKVRCFENPHLGIYDLGMGLLQFLSHKPKVGLIRQGSSLFESLLPNYYRLQTPLIFKKEAENMLQFISQFDHEMNYVLWSSENEITSEILLDQNAAAETHKLISAKRVFSIQVKSHFDPSDIVVLKENPYAVIVLTGTLFDFNKCLVLHTEKLKTPSMIGHFQTRLGMDFPDVSALLNPSETQNQVLATNVLRSPLNYFSQFATPAKTLEDRFVLVSKTVTGAALKEALGLTDAQAFAPSQLPLRVIESFPNWWDEARQSNLIRGLLVLNKKHITAADFWIRLEKMHEDLTRQSTWTI